MTPASRLADQLEAEAARADIEVQEIDLLATQAKTEAGHQATRRSAAADKLAKLGDSATAREVLDLANQVVTLTRRSALMDAQLEILEGKQRSTARLQETIRDAAARVRALAAEGSATAAAAAIEGAADDAVIPPAISRLVLTAQEDLRREIARAMHDGPAQSLTNIVLQAEIVERLVQRDPALAANEVGQLVAMVQQTLEATKTFIFDVRPMVLDDLGLVPTLRRSARDRGRRAGVAVEFDSIGVDRRLPVELESGLFRIIDEALAAYLAAAPDRASLALDWGDVLTLTVRAERAVRSVPALDIPDGDEALPPALASMVADRRAQHVEAIEAAQSAATVHLPARLLRGLSQRAATLGLTFDVLDDGGAVRLSAALPGNTPDTTVSDAPG